MRLKRLELFGFKSFADRMVLDFSAPVVGIVGPNGCGKSNVVDAVRWALGETRPTSMRGGEMTDVIFKGSSSRPPLSVAEVTLVLDNAENDLDGRGAEVSVTRRVYKSGEGEYLIDGTIVRLRDVREMLYGTGLGSRGYSVLEQGKIDAILSANPLERRAIFEEAAGISRYRARKKEAESRLERVHADCQRLDDVLAELERRKRSLKLQAGRAQRYVEARDGWLRQGTRLVRHQALALERSLALSTSNLAQAEGGVGELREQRNAAERDGATVAAEQEALQGAIERAGADSAEAAAELRGLDERRSQLAERARTSLRAAREEEARAADLDQRLSTRRDEARALDEAITALEEGVRAAGERALLLADRIGELEARLVELVQTHEAQSESVLKLLHARTTDQNHLQALERGRGLLAERLTRSGTRCRELDGEIDAGRTEESARARELEALAAALQELEGRRGALEGQAQGLESQRSGLESRRNALEVEIARLSSRVESLRDWEEERAGLEAGARELFRARDRGEEPARSAELLGLLADHLHPDSRHARALDAALGARAQAVVASSGEGALAIVGWLRERAAGRVSLVLSQAWGATSGAGEAPADVRASAGVEGSLADLARPEPQYRALVDFLLGDAWLASDLTAALELVRRFPALRFVTPEGDLVDAAGVSGGYAEVTHGPLGRRSTAAELDERRGRESEELARLEQELERLGSDQNANAAQMFELGTALQRNLERRSRLASAVAAQRARLAELERARELARGEHTERLEERTRMEVETREVGERLQRSEAALASERTALEELERSRAALELERDGHARDEGRARLEATGLSERLEAARRERQQRLRAAEEAEHELARSRRLAEDHEKAAKASTAEEAELGTRRDELLERRGRLEEELVTLRARERDARRVLEELRTAREGLTSELERAVNALGELRLERQRLELARDDVARRAREDFALVPEDLTRDLEPDPELFPEVALEALADEVRKLRTSLEELGPVNLEAVGELKEVEERHGFLDGQRTDLGEARRTLEETVRRLNEESERKFLQAFEEIREHFRTLFRQLFGGGKADISLLEGQSVLDAGIEILARPPGREVLPISLLSGGQRTLTALAILFAVFRSQPSPFCILDEVDAALDDANIGRFLALLSETLDETQFVVVTHNKGTMAACQMLYGVTMAVRGVSHVVSVELSQVDEIVPPRRREVAAGAGADARPAVERDGEGLPEEAVASTAPGA